MDVIVSIPLAPDELERLMRPVRGQGGFQTLLRQIQARVEEGSLVPPMTREGIIACRRELQVPDQFQEQWVTLADIGFDGDWVSPIQKISNSRTGPVLVAKHWLPEDSSRVRDFGSKESQRISHRYLPLPLGKDRRWPRRQDGTSIPKLVYIEDVRFLRWPVRQCRV